MEAWFSTKPAGSNFLGPQSCAPPANPARKSVAPSSINHVAIPSRPFPGAVMLSDVEATIGHALKQALGFHHTAPISASVDESQQAQGGAHKFLGGPEGQPITKPANNKATAFSSAHQIGPTLKPAKEKKELAGLKDKGQLVGLGSGSGQQSTMGIIPNVTTDLPPFSPSKTNAVNKEGREEEEEAGREEEGGIATQSSIIAIPQEVKPVDEFQVIIDKLRKTFAEEEDSSSYSLDHGHPREHPKAPAEGEMNIERWDQ